MSIVSVIILAFSMTADAFAVALCKGAADKHPQFSRSIKTAAIFGLTEGCTPIIGWLLGSMASSYIAAYDHWVAFVILAGIGAKMIYESFQPVCETEETRKPSGIHRVMLTALATSIDAMAVGITLAFMDVNIWLCAASMAFATFVMVIIGLMAGHYIGSKFGKVAEAIGGVALIVIGALIVCEHVGFL